MAASARLVAPNADIVSKAHALMVNCSAAKGLQNVLKTNLGVCGIKKKCNACVCGCGWVGNLGRYAE
jgi:hypothetical protein